jgi:8-oxo-dGTP pyrophosphatase MutT (NUDIX family)
MGKFALQQAPLAGKVWTQDIARRRKHTEKKSTMGKHKQKTLSLAAKNKRDVRSQFGALCYRFEGGKLQILIVTSRRSRKWIVPKGWPMSGKTPAQTAGVEAWEEAGVIGKANENCIGHYSYTKDAGRFGMLPCVVSLFAIKVKRTAQKYPENSLRKRRWVGQKKAANLVHEPELAQLIRNFAPEK